VNQPAKHQKSLGVPLAAMTTLALLTASPGYAQTGPIEEIVVVGSRIEKPDFAFSNPVQSIGADTISYSGTTNLGNFLKEFPALTGSLDANDAAGSNAFIGGTGLTLLNLRNLGTDRTLVLVNGRRHVAALPGSASVDIDTMPIELVERVEILTGGASAVYGADGVSGVVNFVMKDDFEGVTMNARTGQSSESDAQTYLVSGTAGKSLFDGRGHGALAVEWSREERLRANDRDFAGGGERYSFMNNPFADTPERVPLRDIRFFDSSPAGAVGLNYYFYDEEFDDYYFAPSVQFNGTDTPWDSGTIPFIDPYYQQGGDGSRTDQFIGDLLPEKERVTVNGFFDYEINARMNFFSELKYSRNDSFSRAQPSFDFYLLLEPDYAFYPPNIAAALDDAINAGESFGALVSRDHFDLGVRAEDIERETWRGVFGVEGDLTDNLSYEVSYVYGETDVTNVARNNRLNDRFAAALDAVIDPGTGRRSVARPSMLPPRPATSTGRAGSTTTTPIGRPAIRGRALSRPAPAAAASRSTSLATTSRPPRLPGGSWPAPQQIPRSNRRSRRRI
jgi:iron complex outermembrane recepter protein